jgi:putative flippase GtrA
MNFRQHATIVRFLIAGGFNTLFGWAVYSCAILLGLQPWLALIVGIVTGIAFNFFSLGAYAFRDLALRRLPRFLLSYGFIYAANLLGLHALKPWVEDPIWAQLILTPLMAILSYFLLSRMVFVGARDEDHKRNA